MTQAPTHADLIAQFGWEDRGQTSADGGTGIRTASGEDALLYGYADEAMASRVAAAHAVAGEQIFAIPELVNSGPQWVVVREPQGRPLLEVLPELEGQRAVSVIESLGKTVRKLHQLPCELFCGDIGADAVRGQSKWLTFSGYVAHQLEWFSENLRQPSFLEHDRESLAAAIGDLRHELSAFHPRNPACLCHGKLGLNHIWVDDAAREIVGITGFEFAAQTPREADIAYLLWIADIGADDRLVRAFYGGYGAARTMDVQRRERFYRRLVAFQALFGAKGEVPTSAERLIVLTSSSAL